MSVWGIGDYTLLVLWPLVAFPPLSLRNKQRPAHSDLCVETLRDHMLQLGQGHGHGLSPVLQLQLHNMTASPGSQRLQLFSLGAGSPTVQVQTSRNSLLSVPKPTTGGETDGSNQGLASYMLRAFHFISFNAHK